MKDLKGKYIGIVLACLLLLSVFTVPAAAHCYESECNHCYSCGGDDCECVYDGCPSCGTCRYCPSGKCSCRKVGDCTGGDCPLCEVCSECNCECFEQCCTTVGCGQAGIVCKLCQCIPDPNDPGNQSGGKNASNSPEPVYLKTGEYFLSNRDLSVQGRSLPVQIVRTYGNRNKNDDSNIGYGWDMNYNIKAVKDDSNTIILFDGKNRSLKYTLVAGSDPNKYTAPAGVYDYIIENQSGICTLYKKYGTKLGFNSNGNISAITDRHNNSINFSYNGDFLETITDDLGREINLSYSSGLLSTVTDFAGRTWTYSYDGNNNLHTVTGPNTVDYPDGLIVTYAYSDGNDIHNLTSVTDPNGQTYLTVAYNANDEATEQTYGYGIFKLSYNPDVNEATVTDRRDVNEVTVYNSTGNPLSRTIYTKGLRPGDPEYYRTRYEYNSDMEITRKTFPAGNFIDYTYDANGNILSIFREPNDGEPNIVTAFTYEPNFGFVKTITDPRSKVTTYTYDYEDPNYGADVGNLMKITFPEVNIPGGSANPVVGFTYNDANQLETITLPDGMVVKGEYYDDSNPNDPNCSRLQKVIVDYNGTDPNALNITTEFKYDILGNVIEVNDPNGNITAFAYSMLNQLTEITAPEPNHITLFWYNDCEKLSLIERETSGPNQITSFTYDMLDHLKTATDPLDYVTKYSYDASENLSDVNDAEENNTHYDYDERDLLWKITDANGGVTRFSYTTNGYIKDINDAKGNVTTYDYDGFDRLICIAYPNDTNETFGYDKNSNVTSWKNRKDETIYYEYDTLNRLVLKSRPGDPNIIIRYDVAGRVYDVNDGRAVTAGGGVTSYSYDRIGRVTEVNNIEGRVIKYEYDERGLRTKLDHYGPDCITYKYDALGRLTQVKYNYSGFGNNGVMAEYQYDELSRRTLITLGNDANAVYDYDLASRLKKLTNNINDATTNIFDYNDYDKVGNRLGMKVDDTDEHSYDYDKLYQLTEVNYPDNETVAYYYDVLGNRTSVINVGTTDYNSNDLNQYTSVGGTSYSYDDNGNLIDAGMYLYYYDCENRLTDVNDANDAAIVSYKYDFAGRRVRKIVYGEPDVVTRYCYDGWQVICEFNANGMALRRFTYGPGIDEPVCMRRTPAGGGFGMFYYHYDGLGSVVAISDANGVVIENYEYDVFGAPMIWDVNAMEIVESSIVGNPYMFTGRRYDNETGDYYYRLRYYKPAIGRFLQTDPIGYFAGLNLYTYVGNNPLNWIDPWGLGKESGGGTGGGGGIGSNTDIKVSAAMTVAGAATGSSTFTVATGAVGFAGPAMQITAGVNSWNQTANEAAGFEGDFYSGKNKIFGPGSIAYELFGPGKIFGPRFKVKQKQKPKPQAMVEMRFEREMRNGGWYLQLLFTKSAWQKAD